MSFQRIPLTFHVCGLGSSHFRGFYEKISGASFLMECFREFIQKSPRNVFILSTTYPIEFLIISNQKNSENLNMLRFNWKPWVIGNWCFYLWINFRIQTSPFSWSESDILLYFQPCQGGSIWRKYPEEVSGGSIRRKYLEDVHRSMEQLWPCKWT